MCSSTRLRRQKNFSFVTRSGRLGGRKKGQFGLDDWLMAMSQYKRNSKWWGVRLEECLRESK